MFYYYRFYKNELKKAEATGVPFERMRITTSEIFSTFNPGIRLPVFVWLQIHGTPGVDDFGLSPDHRLIVSGMALGLLSEIGIPSASFEDF